MFNIYRMLFLASQKVRMIKITPPQIPTPPVKNIPPAKFLTLSTEEEFPLIVNAI